MKKPATRTASVTTAAKQPIDRVIELWPRLSLEQRVMVLDVVKSTVEANEAKAEEEAA